MTLISLLLLLDPKLSLSLALALLLSLCRFLSFVAEGRKCVVPNGIDTQHDNTTHQQDCKQIQHLQTSSSSAVFIKPASSEFRDSKIRTKIGYEFSLRQLRLVESWCGVQADRHDRAPITFQCLYHSKF